MEQPIILHSDMNNFYASVECLDNPGLRGKPVAVAGDQEARHGIVLAKNYEAKKYGIVTGDPLWMARQKCPDIILTPPRYERYIEMSQAAHEIYGEYTDKIETFGLDECWLDVTASSRLFGDGKVIADEIRNTIKTELGLTASVGVSYNKIFAKLGSDLKKPDATTVITRENFRDKVWPLPVTDLLFVGRASSQVLGQYGVRTIGDLAAFGREPLTELLGKMGGQLYDYAAGLEHSPVVPARALPPPKSIGNSITFRRNLVGPEDIRTGVALLSDSVAARLRKHAMRCATVQVTIRDPGFRNICRQKRLDIPICTSTELSRAAMELIRESWNMNAPIRLLAITGQNLVPEDQAAEQMDLFLAQTAPRRERREQLERAVDGIRGKFGKGAIVPAAVVGEDIDRPADHAGSIPPGGRKLE